MTMLSKLNRILLGAAVAVAFTGVAQAATDLQLTIANPDPKTTGALPVHYGETIAFKATVTNLGAENATGAKITAVTVPAGWELAEITNCTKVAADQTGILPCLLTSPGAATKGEIFSEIDAATPKYAVTAKITLAAPNPATLPDVCPDPTATLSTTVTIASDADLDPSNDTATSRQFVIAPWQDLGIELVAPQTAGYGDNIDVQVKVTNHGACPATSVRAYDEAGGTAYTLEFLGAEGACTTDPLAWNNDTNKPIRCDLGTMNVGDTKEWTLHYKVTGYPSSLTSSQNPVSLTVFSAAADAFDPNSGNDVKQTKTVATRSQGGCSTGELGGALSLLALGVPFLRRRRKS